MTVLEGGIRKQRIQFVRESTVGEVPSDPSWDLFSDNVRSTSTNPDGNVSARRKVGDPDVQGHHTGSEENEYVVTYDLQQWFSASGDAAYDGMARGNDNELPSTHTIVEREDHASGGADSGGVRIYTVVTGAHIANVELTGEPETGEPVQVQVTYQAERIRSYQIDQPAASGQLTVQSSDAGDTTQTLTVEDEDAGTSEDVSLNGTTGVTTTASFADIDAAYLDAECAGDVTIETSGGTVLMTIYGSDEYDGVEGDLGVPALGSGSNASAIGSDYEIFLNDTIQRGGSDMADHINSVSLSVDNNLDSAPQLGTRKRKINAGNRDVQVTATLYGESRSHDAMVEHFRKVASNVVWTLTGGTLTVSNAVLTDPGDRVKESGQAKMQLSNVFEGRGLTIS